MAHLKRPSSSSNCFWHRCVQNVQRRRKGQPAPRSPSQGDVCAGHKLASDIRWLYLLLAACAPVHAPLTRGHRLPPGTSGPSGSPGGARQGHEGGTCRLVLAWLGYYGICKISSSGSGSIRQFAATRGGGTGDAPRSPGKSHGPAASSQQPAAASSQQQGGLASASASARRWRWSCCI